MAINNVCISGNLVKDAEQFTAGDTPACEFALSLIHI